MEEKINFKYYLSILTEQTKLIIIVALIISLPFFLLSLNVSYYYESYALVEILRVPYSLPYESDTPLYGSRVPSVNIPKTIAKLRTVQMANAVLARLSLKTYRDFEDELTLKEKIVASAKKMIGEKRVTAIKKILKRSVRAEIDSTFYNKMILDNYRSRLKINYSGNDLIKIKMLSEQSSAAFECVQKFIEQWKDQNLAEKKYEIITAKQLLEKLKAAAETEVSKNEKQLNKYRQRLGLNYDDIPILGQIEMKTLSKYEKELTASQGQLDRISSKLFDLNIKIANIKGNLKIIEPPRIDLTASGASRMKLKIMGLILGLSFGSGLALLRGMLDTSVKSEEEIKSITNIPIIGALPKFDNKN